jgi:hypothetical protein
MVLYVLLFLMMGVSLCYSGLIMIFDHDRAWNSSVKDDHKFGWLFKPLIRDEQWERATTELGVFMFILGIFFLFVAYKLI